jgi:O-antigen/teichoic acid export membrane protein
MMGDNNKVNRPATGKKVSYVYLDVLIGMFVGYILWLLLSRLTSPDVIGVASTVISVSTIFSIIADLGANRGSTLFLGKSFLEGHIDEAKILIKASLLIITFGILVSGLLIVIFRDLILPDVSIGLILISILLLGFAAIYNLMRSFIIASLQTQLLPLVTIISSATKTVLTIILILIGTGAIGITVGYLSAYISASILFFFLLSKMMKPGSELSTLSFYRVCKKILYAGIVSWVPKVMAIIGSRLGTVVVFGFEGANQAGLYFIAFSIYYVTVAITDSLYSVLLPILGAMSDRRKRMVWQAMKLNLVVTVTIASAAIAYSDDIMMLFGTHYIDASMTLKILLLSVLPFTFNIAIGTLVYSYGNYWQVLALGLASSVPRIIFYFVFVPMYGNNGAALSFTLGSIIGFVVSLVVAKKIGMSMFWKELVPIVAIPAGISFATAYLMVSFNLGIPIIIVFSLASFIAFGILSKSDINYYLAILPTKIQKPLDKIVNKFFP